MQRCLRSFVFVLLLSLCLAPAALAGEQPFSIHAPDAVGVGQPFLVKVVSPHELEDVDIFWDGKSVSPAACGQGDCRALALFGTSLYVKFGLYSLEVEASVNGERRRLRKLVRVEDHEYPTETLRVAPGMVKPPKKFHARIEREREKSKKAISTVSSERLWEAPFSLPVKGKMLSRFGLRRTFNGDTKRRHWGLDFRAWLGTPIRAIAPGKVILVGDNFYYAGNCVYIDHGNGVVSMSVHMSKVLVREGQMVERGQKIGLSGSTGRSTGAHLHLSVFAQGVAIDPEPLFKMQ
ncbi:M23 family metallopeptidase [Salidesulfovibrio onnuriiensis]|uniref:M23 family metallopeptidase n=1 Tax=Salidesulfovibrio onnuriiensis TaxID=2583823 RepID=UPI0011CB3309|nr:M23 family metallopeptidase [Salidesulfovibrio onnuriiensis]